MPDHRILYLVPGALSRSRGEQELERRQSILQSWAAAGIEMGISENPSGPESIESAYEEYVSIPGSLDVAADAEAEGYDAVVLGCFGDPGLDAFRELLNIPIIGPCEASIHVAASLGHRFGIVTVLDAITEPLRKLVRTAGLDTRLATVVACEIPVLELDEDSYEPMLETCRDAITAGADTLILGCMSMAFLGVAERLSEDLSVPVVNPARTSLKTAELLLGSGLRHSKRAFPTPRKLAVGQPH